MAEAILNGDGFAAPAVDEDAELVLDPYPDRGDRKAGRRVKLAVSWETKTIIHDLAPHLRSLVYVDNLTGAADDLAIVLEDRFQKWSKDWRPEYGDKVVARAEAEGWFGFGDPVTELKLGTFAHDKISLDGPPSITTLSCVSAPLATGLRRRKRTRTWKGVDLKQIAQDIANRAELTLGFDGDPGTKYKHAQQNNKSDLEFLEDLCKEVGRTLKVSESVISIYEELSLDGRPAVGEIDLHGGRVIEARWDGDDSGRYGSCHVKFFDPRTGKVHKAQFPPEGQTIKGLDPNGQTLELVMPVHSKAEAAARAKALLRNANRFATSGQIKTHGDLGLVAGITFDLKNAGGLDGKFIITRAEHNLVGGHTTTVKVRRCLEGY